MGLCWVQKIIVGRKQGRSFFNTRLNGKMNDRFMAEMIGANTHWYPLCLLVFLEGFQKSFATHNHSVSGLSVCSCARHEGTGYWIRDTGAILLELLTKWINELHVLTERMGTLSPRGGRAHVQSHTQRAGAASRLDLRCPGSHHSDFPFIPCWELRAYKVLVFMLMMKNIRHATPWYNDFYQAYRGSYSYGLIRISGKYDMEYNFHSL